MTTAVTTCHSCGSEMEASSSSTGFACPGCEYIADVDGVQRRYSTGTPCSCELCTARLEAQARLSQAPPLVKLLGQALVALVRAGVERRRDTFH